MNEAEKAQSMRMLKFINILKCYCFPLELGRRITLSGRDRIETEPLLFIATRSTPIG